MTLRTLLKTLKNIDLIQCLIIENYTYKKGYISKWFSTLEVSREIMDYEQKVTFKNRRVAQACYKQWYYETVNPINSEFTAEFTNGHVIEKHYSLGKLDGTTTITEEEYWKRHFDCAIYNSDAVFNNHNDVISETVSCNGQRQLRTYEYQYDHNGNWIERKMCVNSKLTEVTIRKFKYGY